MVNLFTYIRGWQNSKTQKLAMQDSSIMVITLRQEWMVGRNSAELPCFPTLALISFPHSHIVTVW